MANLTPITQTKIIIPRRRAELLSRPRLLQLVEDLLDYRLMILTAPAGYGKTSLMVDFAQSTAWPVCWYALDALDQDPQRFIAHFIAAIRKRFPAFGQDSQAALESTSQSALDTQQFAGQVVNDLYEHVSEHFLIVIDDFHLVESSPPVVRFLNRFLQDMDENCHVALNSRTLLALPDMSLMVARSQVGGLSFEDLAFQPEEIQALLLRNGNIQLSDSEAQALAAETEGWVTGLLLSTQIMGKTVAQQARVARVSGVGVFEYLAQQIFERQEPEIQSFLLWTALLEEFDAQACQEVICPALGVTLNPHLLIENLLRRNLFILPVGEDGLTLRYHHLFQAFLSQRAQRDRPDEVRRILMRQAEVCADREEWERAFAILQQLAGEASPNDYSAYQPLVALVEQAGSQLIARGRLLTLAAWFNALPTRLLNDNPRLVSLRGTLTQDRGDPSTALRLHTQAIEALRELDDPLALALAHIRRATAYRQLSQYRESSSDAGSALAILEPRYTTNLLYADALLSQGIALYFLGQPDLALAWCQRALPAYQLLKDDSAVAKTFTHMGVLYKTLGRFSEAERAYQQALALSQSAQNMVWQANLYNSMALLQHTLGHYAEALYSFDQAVQHARASGAQRMEAYVLAGIGDLYLELDAINETRQAYMQAREAAVNTNENFLLFYLDLMEARLALCEYATGGYQGAEDRGVESGRIADRQGDQGLKGGTSALARARALVNSAGVQVEELGSRYQTHFFMSEQARLALAEGNFSEARSSALQALAFFAGESYHIETPGARVLAMVACALAGDDHAASMQAAALLELLPNPDLAKLLAVAAREQARYLKTLSTLSSLQPAAGGLLRLAGQFEDNIPGWRRSVRRHAELVPFAPPRLHIRALGKIQVKAGQRTLTGADWQVQAARDLLFLLLAHPEGLTKEQIGELFWPDSSPSELKLRFKNTLYRLRHAAGKEVIVFEGDTLYRFNHSMDYEYDVEDFLKETALAEKAGQRDAAAQRHYRNAIKVYRGPYLPDVDLEWALVERQRLQQIHIEALLALAHLQFEHHDNERALALCQQALAIDSCQEEAHRLLMRIYAVQGNRAMVVRQYDLCVKSLLEELAADPSTQTRALYQTLTR